MLAPMGVSSMISKSVRSDPYLPGVAALILLFALWGASFSHSCQSDGCIGIIFPMGAAAALLALQLFVCLPVLLFRWNRRRQPVGAVATIWLALSLAAFGVPLLFVK